MRKMICFQMVLADEDLGQTGRLFRPKHYDDKVSVPLIHGYCLEIAPVNADVVAANDRRMRTTVHLGSHIQSFDDVPQPDIAMHHFSHFYEGTTTTPNIGTERTPWCQLDGLLVPYVFVGLVIDQSTTTLDYVLTGNMVFEWVDISEEKFMELSLMYNLDFQEPAALTPSLPARSIRDGNLVRPYWTIRSTEEV